MDIEIVSGFLGAGKTTFLNQYLPLLTGKTVVVENEYGEIGLDGDLIQSDIPVKELYAGCICCSLAVDFRNGIREIARQYQPDRIVIEPSGVGKLSDIVKVCEKVRDRDGVELEVTRRVAVMDGSSYEEYADGFGTFYLDQIRQAQIIFCSQMEELSEEQKAGILEDIRKRNPDAVIYEGDFRKLEGEELAGLLKMAEQTDTTDTEMSQEAEEESNISGAAELTFSSISFQNIPRMTKLETEALLEKLQDRKYGRILRAKGILETPSGEKLQIDVTLSHACFQSCKDRKESRVVVIGSALNRLALEELFQKKSPVRLPKRSRI